jgi:hypothetical protein
MDPGVRRDDAETDPIQPNLNESLIGPMIAAALRQPEDFPPWPQSMRHPHQPCLPA